MLTFYRWNSFVKSQERIALGLSDLVLNVFSMYFPKKVALSVIQRFDRPHSSRTNKLDDKN